MLIYIYIILGIWLTLIKSCFKLLQWLNEHKCRDCKRESVLKDAVVCSNTPPSEVFLEEKKKLYGKRIPD